MADDEKLINEVLRDSYNSVGGQRPRPLTSSWCLNERFPAPVKPAQHIFFLDELSSGNTVARAYTLQTAYDCLLRLDAEGIKTCIRPETIDEESRQRDSSLRKWKSQMGYNN